MSDKSFYGRLVGKLNRRRALGVVATGAGSIAVISACGRGGSKPSAGGTAPGQAQADKPRLGGTYNSYSQYNALLDPQKVSTGGTQTLASGVMSRLFRYKTSTDPKLINDHDIESDLGLSAESPDAVTWTVKLRPKIHFQNVPPVNGHAVEAQDIKETFIRFVTLPPNPNRGALGMIDPNQIDVPAADTLVFRLKYPYAPFQKLLASGAYGWIFPREAIDGGYDPAKQMIGSGPFIMENFTPDVAYVFKKSPDWFEPGRPYVDSVRYAIIQDATQRLAQFTAGNLDDLSIQIPDVDAVKQANPKAAFVPQAPSNSNSIYLQLGDPASPFQDIRVRRALSMVVDRDTLSKVSFNGQGKVMVFVPLTLGKWSISPDDLDPSTAQYFKYNPAEAKKLLDAAGASNLALRFAYIANAPFSNPAYRSLYETIGHMLGDAGIKVTLIDHDYNKDFVDAGHGSRQGYFDKEVVVFGGIAQYTEADEYIFSYFHSKSASNGERLNDSKLDSMIDKARTIVNETDRLKAYQDIQKYIAQQMYVVPTCGGGSYVVTQPWVANYNLSVQTDVFAETYSKVWLSR